MGDERGGARDPDHARGYRKLIAWQKSHQLATTIYSATRAFPREDFWAQQQICRAAFSVPSNIAEGYTRRSRREYLHFLNIARASLAEVEYQLFFMQEVGLLDAATRDRIDRLRAEVGITLYRLVRSLEGPPASNTQLREPDAEYLAGGEFNAYQDEINGAPFEPLTQ